MPQELRTLVFTDLVNSTAVKAHLPGPDISARNQAYFETILAPHRQRMEVELAQYGGRVVKTEGDAYFLDFSLPTNAAQWAVSVQKSHQKNPIATPLGPLKVRIGMHTGAPLRDPVNPDDFVGGEVDYAARISALAAGEQIVLSAATAALVKDAGIAGLQLHAHGERDLKGIGRAPVFELLYDGAPPRPLQQAARAPHNLPAPPTPFVGREIEVQRWLELLRQPSTRLLTLTGFGGLGKTRSALELAKRCAEQGADQFPSGIWWIELAEARTEDAMVQRIAQDLNFYVQTPPTAREQVLNLLRDQRSLLVLDNTEQIPNAAVVIQELLSSAPHLKCLVTTRRALQLRGEHQVEVLPMPLEEARELFVARAQERKAEFEVTPDNSADIVELCRRLEGVPLALELAASRISLSSPREILQRLDQRFRLLQIRSPDLPARQRALRGTIDWSYELLGEEDRDLFTQLAVFARGFTVEDAEVVCDAFDVFEGLHELQNQSLVRSETDTATQQTRFFMLESVRDYAAEKLEELPDRGQEVRSRHAKHYLNFAQERLAKLRTFGEVEAFRELGAGFDNVTAAMDWSQGGNEAELCAELALQIARYLARAGFQNEAVRRVEIGQEALRRLSSPPARLRAELLRERAGLYHDALDAAGTRECATQAIALFEELNDSRGLAHCHNLLALAARDAKDFAGAREHLQLALQAFEHIKDTAGMATVHTNFGVVLLEAPEGNEDEASNHLQQALRLCSQIGDKRGNAEVSNNIGLLAWQRGDMEVAERYYTESLNFEHELGHIFGVGRSCFNLGEVAEALGKWPRAMRLFAAAESLFGKAGSPYQPYAASSLEAAAAMLQLDAAALAELRRLPQEKSLGELIAWTRAAEDGDEI